MSIKKRLRKLNRMQLQIFAVLLSGCILPMILLSSHMVGSYLKRAQKDREEAALQLCEELSVRIRRTSYLTASSQTDISSALDMAAEFYDGRILVINSELLVVKDTSGRADGKTMISEKVIGVLRGTLLSGGLSSGQGSIYRNHAAGTVELIYPIRDTASGTVLGAMVFVYSTEPVSAMVNALSRAAILFDTAVIVIAVLIFLVFSGRLTLPLRRLAFRLQQFADGYREEKLEAGGSIEVQEITESLNNVLDEMRDTEKRRQEFVSNVSHELKTPLASMKVLSDSLLAEKDVPIELYQEFLTDINSEIERENKIISDLLELVRLDHREGMMQVSHVSINELLEIILRRLRPIAKEANVEMVFESFRSVIAEVDEVKLSQVFTNLIENAIKYNVKGGMVKVSLNSDHKYFYVKVEDTGIGIPEEARKYIFDRFYRVDKAHSRETGGTGLGLAIAKSAVLMHKGSIKVSGREGEGTAFVVRIPLSFVPDANSKEKNEREGSK